MGLHDIDLDEDFCNNPLHAHLTIHCSINPCLTQYLDEFDKVAKMEIEIITFLLHFHILSNFYAISQEHNRISILVRD